MTAKIKKIIFVSQIVNFSKIIVFILLLKFIINACYETFKIISDGDSIKNT